MKQANRFEIRYGIHTAAGAMREKSIRVIGEEKRDNIIRQIREHGYQLISRKKLYPFNCYKNQHNFELINNICRNRLYDMESGEIPMDDAEYDRLENMAERAEKYFCMGCDPMTYVPYEVWKDMRELSEMAILHRQDACIANGRPDLVTYC